MLLLACRIQTNKPKKWTKISAKTQANQAHAYREQIGSCQRWEVGKMGEGGQKVPLLVRKQMF